MEIYFGSIDLGTEELFCSFIDYLSCSKPNLRVICARPKFLLKKIKGEHRGGCCNKFPAQTKTSISTGLLHDFTGLQKFDEMPVKKLQFIKLSSEYEYSMKIDGTCITSIYIVPGDRETINGVRHLRV